ncbi:MAG: class I SAM-dependent methyltransferase [Proteobacteria bacterium]|nr:class I SAM-dependent methyltransferase [Pseudomonadota bacterium]
MADPSNTEVQVDDLLCDFVGGAVGHRLRFGGGKGQALPKAIGMKGQRDVRVVDATAGLGRDAFLLASLGAEVTLIERSAEMHRRLQEGMQRAHDAGGIHAEIISRMTLLHGDARSLLATLDPEIVLVDPMHPPRNSTALVKKEMRQVRALVGEDADSAELIEAALATASKRVVLKWPRKAPLPEGIRAPSHQILGKSTRYDVFMMHR